MIVGIILAAGDSSRMGTPKALLEFEGGTFLAAVRGRMREAGISEIITVLGRHAEIIKKSGNFEDGVTVINPEPEKGQISSLCRALERIPAGGEAALVALVDQPGVKTGTCRALMASWKANRGKIVIPVYKGKRGHPIVLDKKAWPLCFRAPLDKGLHWVIHHESMEILNLTVDDPNVLKDVDTPEDYQKLCAH